MKNNIRTGIDGLDEILAGGLPKNRLYLLHGDPGAGKTTMALQFLLEGKRQKEPCLYITLSETKDELRAVAESHEWNLDGIHLLELASVDESLKEEQQQSTFHPSEVELHQTTKVLLDEVDRVQPRRVVIDSLAELRLLAQNPLRYRRQILSLKNYFSGRETTVMLLDDNSSGRNDTHVESLAHGVIELRQWLPEYGSERRRLRVVKMRGVRFVGGYHEFHIQTGGIVAHPRITEKERFVPSNTELFPSGVTDLDNLLNGGIKRGTSMLIIGPAGVGKSTLAAQYINTALNRGERAVFYSFEEGPSTFFDRTEGIGIRLADHLKNDQFRIREINPSELSPLEFVRDVYKEVEKHKAKVVVIDSLNGYMNAMPEERLVAVQLRDLLSFLRRERVVAILIVSQHGLLGAGMQAPLDVSYLADTVLLLRYFESMGHVRQAISVVKKRGGKHERTLREFSISSNGITVGKPLTEFHGVLTGIPVYRGDAATLMKGKDKEWNNPSTTTSGY